MKFRQSLFSVMLTLSCCSMTAQAAGTTPIPLHFGSNTIKFGGSGNSGEMAIAMLGHRENFNAHGFDVLTLYIKPAPTNGAAEDWQFVSIFDNDKEALTLTRSGGADCVLHDFRLLKGGPQGLKLVVAERELGASYADAAPVSFKFYELRRNAEGEVGMPLYYFALTGSKPAQRPYCDVGEALANELKIGAWHPQ